MASRIGLRLMPNFRASSASFMRPPGLRRPDVISFNRKLRTCSDRLSVSKNEMAPSHAEIFGRLCADCGQKVTRVKRAPVETRRRPRSPISAKCSAPVGARRSFLSLDCMIFHTYFRRTGANVMPSEPPEPAPWCQRARQWAGDLTRVERRVLSEHYFGRLIRVFGGFACNGASIGRREREWRGRLDGSRAVSAWPCAWPPRLLSGV